MSDVAEDGLSHEPAGPASSELICLDSPELACPVSSEFAFSDSHEPGISGEPDAFGLFSALSALGLDMARLDLSEFDTHEPLGILVELAKSGTIDPWDIDIVELTDSFLGRVEELKQLDLRVSSRTLLYSAILLRMKSSGIFQEEEEDEEDSDFFEDMDFPEPEKFPIPRLPVRRVATRPVTLNELIVELKKAEKALSRKNDRKRLQASETGPEGGPVPFQGDVLEIAHEEVIVERVGILWEKLEKLFGKHSCVTFSALLEGSSDKVMDYITLLFLASSKKVWLCQKELFGELFIYPGEESGFSTEKKPLPGDSGGFDEKMPGPESTDISGAEPEGPVSGNTAALSSKQGFAEVNPEEPLSFGAESFDE